MTSAALSTSDPGSPLSQYRRLLRIQALFRVTISLVLLMLFIPGNEPGATQFLYAAGAYTALNVGWLLYLQASGYRAGADHVTWLQLCDLPAFLTMIHATGGLSPGLGYLLLTSAAAGTLLLERRRGALLAALAASAVIAQQLLGLYAGASGTRDLVAAGSLALLLLLAVSGLQQLSGLITRANRQAQRQRRHAEDLQQLAEQIIENMDTGVLVLDARDHVLLANRAARRLLPGQLEPGSGLETTLQAALDRWRSAPETESQLVRMERGPQLRLSPTSLPRTTGNYLLVFIEDNRKLVQAAQQMKLSSLGHLTASIAHEVRNPLGAISHAAQLLGESGSLTDEDRHLADIIYRHGTRVNRTVENVLKLSRRHTPEPRLHDLGFWTECFITDYRLGMPGEANITLDLPNTRVIARFDDGQLGQALTNLCNNALTHSRQNNNIAEFTLRVYRHRRRDCAVLEVLDAGPGVPDAMREQVFEPFFTTSNGGSGLGLYIARELCQANRASLQCCRKKDGRSCFRIEFSHVTQQAPAPLAPRPA